MAAAEEKSVTMAGKDSITIMAAAEEEEEKCVTMTGKDSTTAMAAAEEEEEESVTKVFSMFHLDDDGLIILEDGKRMPSEFYANESITKEKEIERLESENQQLDDMICSLQTTIAKVSEELEAKWEKRMEAIARKRENPEVIKIRAAIAEQIQQMEHDEIKHGQELTRLKVICNRNLLNSAMEDAEKVTKGIEEAKEMVEKLAKAFNELESRREALLPNKTKWADIKEHFDNLEKSLQEKINEVEEKQRIFEEKQSEADKLVAEREAAVAAKELASLDLLQLMKDVAVSAISEAHENCKTPTPVLVDVKGSKDNKVITFATDDPNAPEGNPPDNKSGDPPETIASKVKLRPQLKEVCEKMDAKGLLKILSDNQKLLTTINEEISTALKSAAEPACLVLDSLEGFYPPDPSNNSQMGDDNPLQVLRRTCLVILEAAAPLLVVAEPGNDHPMSSEIKQQAKAIADVWKAKLAGVDIDVSYVYSLEAVAFLQFLVTFSIAEEFHEDELCKLVLAVSRCRQAPELCRSLGLIHRMPGVVDTLVKTGRQVDAVRFVFAFELFSIFPPVPFLKEYLDNVKGNAHKNNGDAAAAGGQDANNKELGALRVITKYIEEFKLQEEYPIEPLKKQIAQLEKARYNKKRLGQAAKTQAKKPRANGGYASRKPAAFVDNRQVPHPVYDDRVVYHVGSDGYTERYAYATQYAYEVASHAPYAQQPRAQRPYYCPEERVGPPPYSSSLNYGPITYGGYAGTGYQSSTQSNYGNYMGSRVQSASPSYGSYMSTGGKQSHQPYM